MIIDCLKWVVCIKIFLTLRKCCIELRKQNLSLDNLLETKKLEIDHWKSEHANLMKTCVDKEVQLVVHTVDAP